MTADLVIRGVVLGGMGPGRRDVVIREGRFMEFSRRFEGDTAEEVFADGALMLPGFVDAHVHFNEPGRTSWEGIATGSRALAAGGVTTFFDMPLNSSPPCLTAADLEAKRTLAKKKSLIDFALWGGLVPGNEREIGGMARAGAVGIKAFLCNSGLDEFPATDAVTLRRGATQCAKHGLVLGVHAEDPAELQRAASEGDSTWRGFVRSRPESCEVEAIRTCVRVAEETGCAFHIVHVSAPGGLELITDAAGRGVNITAETCPHYLLLDQSLMAKIGALAKCAPPLRPPATRRKLWRHLVQGRVLTIGSDHSPSPSRMKRGQDFSKLWGGISGGQHGMLLFLQEARRRNIPWERIVALTSGNVGRRFGLRSKRGIEAGADADFVLLRRGPARRISENELFTRAPLSPYPGMVLEWEVEMTAVRGQRVFEGGRVARAGSAREADKITL